MKHCVDYELEFSALLDGESDPAMAIELMDHMVSCPACRDFYRNLRSFQDLVDDIRPAAEPEAVDAAVRERPRKIREKRRRNPFGVVPRWAWGSAAALAVAVTLWVVGVSDRISGPAIGADGGDLVIKLEENKGDMDERRFVGIVAEVLRADRRYQREMYEILAGIGPGEGTDESYGFSPLGENGGAETYGEMFASARGQQVWK